MAPTTLQAVSVSQPLATVSVRKNGCADDGEDEGAVLDLNECTDHTHGDTEPRLEVLGVRVHTDAIHRQEDEETGEDPATNHTDPVGHEDTHAEGVRAAGIGDEIAGVDGRGVHRQTDEPPGQPAPGEEPVRGRAHTATQIESVEDDAAVED